MEEFSGSKVFSLEDKAKGSDNRDIEFLVKDKINSKKFIYSGTQLNLVNASKNYEIPYLSSYKDSIIKILKRKTQQFQILKFHINNINSYLIHYLNFLRNMNIKKLKSHKNLNHYKFNFGIKLKIEYMNVLMTVP